jgi:transcription initiation factor IIE alpha subunit
VKHEPSSVDVAEFIEKRAEFGDEEWLDILVNSPDYMRDKIALVYVRDIQEALGAALIPTSAV